MAIESSKPARLSRTEISDILKRNFDLYKDEPNFVDYLVELAIYLIQYQFDPKKEEAPTNSRELEDDIAPAIEAEGARVVSSLTNMRPRTSNNRMCPICGIMGTGAGQACPGCGIRYN